MRKFIILVFCIGLSSCATLDKMKDNTNITYNIKKNTFSAKTKINKYITLKY